MSPRTSPALRAALAAGLAVLAVAPVTEQRHDWRAPWTPLVRLAWSIQDGEPVQRPSIVACRYIGC
jgi:hypothetical protein